MKLPIYQVDAFAEKPFEGNPAAICPLESWLSEELMQSIANENNLSETAFFVLNQDIYEIRWFTPVSEVELCGHATLASAHVLFYSLGHPGQEIRFNSKSGMISVVKKGDLLELNFPKRKPVPCNTPSIMKDALKAKILTCLKSDDYVVVLEDEKELQKLNPDFELLKQLDLRGVCVTAPSKEFDFVSRFFAPKYGINEDPVTGSSFTKLIPYWSEVLGKSKLNAKQISPRGGKVFCELSGERVLIAGKTVEYLKGEIDI